MHLQAYFFQVILLSYSMHHINKVSFYSYILQIRHATWNSTWIELNNQTVWSEKTTVIFLLGNFKTSIFNAREVKLYSVTSERDKKIWQNIIYVDIQNITLGKRPFLRKISHIKYHREGHIMHSCCILFHISQNFEVNCEVFFKDFHWQRHSQTLITPNCAAGQNCCGQIFAIMPKDSGNLTKSLCFGPALTTTIRLSVDYPQSGRIQRFNRQIIKSRNWFRPVSFWWFPYNKDNMVKLHPKG